MDRKTLKNYFFIKFKYPKRIIELPLKFRGSEYCTLGKNVKIRKNFRIECISKFAGEILHPSLILKDNVNIGYNFTALVSERISIGEKTIIASNVMITTENHGINPELEIPYSDQKLINKQVTIGKNVWIGQNVIILPGVNIGDNSVIAAGSIVTKNVEPYSLVAGNPAKPIKKYSFEKHEWIKI